MAIEQERQTALGDIAARQLANATKTQPQMSRITPRWLTHLLQWTPVEAGIYRLNRVRDEARVTVDCSDRDERDLPQTFVDYEEPATAAIRVCRSEPAWYRAQAALYGAPWVISQA